MHVGNYFKDGSRSAYVEVVYVEEKRLWGKLHLLRPVAFGGIEDIRIDIQPKIWITHMHTWEKYDSAEALTERKIGNEIKINKTPVYTGQRNDIQEIIEESEERKNHAVENSGHGLADLFDNKA